MPNTEVKLSSAENTCLETDREDRKVLAFPFKEKRAGFRRCLLWQAESVKCRVNRGKAQRKQMSGKCWSFQQNIPL